MISVEYTPVGCAVSDFCVEEFVESRIINTEEAEKVIKVSSETIIEEVRRRIAIGDLEPDGIQFVFDGESSHVNENGMLENTEVQQAIDESGFSNREASCQILESYGAVDETD